MVLGTVHGFPELLRKLLEIHPLLQKVEGEFTLDGEVGFLVGTPTMNVH
jgi:hypothetical protein